MSILFTAYRIREALLEKMRSREQYATHDGALVDLDRTGRVVSSAKVIPVEFDQDKKVCFAIDNYAVAHSYWRAQELSLFMQSMPDFTKPILDFGCGDGSFSKCLCGEVDYGVDVDETALSIAKEYSIYNQLVLFRNMREIIATSSVGTVYSCSVLEHVDDLDECLAEIVRVLSKNGKVFISVPNPNLTQHMSELVSADFAETMNRRMYHRNMFDAAGWRDVLKKAGLDVIGIKEFQPLSFTRNYFNLSMLGNRTVGWIPGFRQWFWNAYKKKMMAEVREAISDGVVNGANYFIEAVKP